MPRRLASAEAVIAFNKASIRIQTGYLERKNNPTRLALIDGVKQLQKREPWDTANGYFLREAYALITKLLEDNTGRNLVQQCARDSDYIPKRTYFSENPFLWGLLALDPGACCLGKGAKKAHRFARLFAHADRNRVPPTYLIGFLMQTGGWRPFNSTYRAPTVDPSLKVGLA